MVVGCRNSGRNQYCMASVNTILPDCFILAKISHLIMKKIFLIRHCKTAAKSGALIGSSDLPILASEYEPVQRLNSVLPDSGMCLCSPLLRTRQTLESLQENGFNLQVKQEQRLQEVDFGSWEGKEFQEIVASDPDCIRDWNAYDNFTFPGGESIEAFVERVKVVLDMVQELPEDNIVLISHGGVIRHFICLALGLPIKHYLLFSVHPGTLVTMDLFAEGAVLTGLNI